MPASRRSDRSMLVPCPYSMGLLVELLLLRSAKTRILKHTPLTVLRNGPKRVVLFSSYSYLLYIPRWHPKATAVRSLLVLFLRLLADYSVSPPFEALLFAAASLGLPSPNWPIWPP
jgi:hypothetical protein